MGAIVNDMCCISRVRENENVKEKGNSYNDDDRNLKELNDKLPNEEKKKNFIHQQK
jgi:hypothetical protein